MLIFTLMEEQLLVGARSPTLAEKGLSPLKAISMLQHTTIFLTDRTLVERDMNKLSSDTRGTKLCLTSFTGCHEPRVDQKSTFELHYGKTDLFWTIFFHIRM